jgi:hypothetical protein
MAYKANLIFDVGLHKGEDTDFYLRKGFRVVAFEAHPDLILNCEVRFERETIFRLYQLFGDDGLLRNAPGGGHLTSLLARLYRKPTAWLVRYPCPLRRARSLMEEGRPG